MLHRELYRHRSEICAILHTHSVYSTVLSEAPREQIVLGGYEMLKALRGVREPQANVAIPIFANEQDMQSLAETVCNECKGRNPLHGFVLARHGLYSLGGDFEEAKRHAEALEFLLECRYRERVIKLAKDEYR